MPKLSASKHVQLSLDLDDPFERAFGEMVARLPRQYLKMWVLKTVRARLGAASPDDMARRLRDDLTGHDGELEEGHKRFVRQSEPLIRRHPGGPLSPQRPSEPLGKQPISEPLHAPAAEYHHPELWRG